MCLLYSFMGYLFQCVVSSCYHVCHMLNVHVHHEKGIHRIVGDDLGDAQVVLDVQSLEKLENLLIHNFVFICSFF